MTTQTTTFAATRSNTAAIIVAMTLGLGMLVVSGMAQATVLHDAAHDQRHAMAFPCH